MPTCPSSFCAPLFATLLFLTQWNEQDEGAADAAVRIFGTSPVSNPHQRRCVPARAKIPPPHHHHPCFLVLR